MGASVRMADTREYFNITTKTKNNTPLHTYILIITTKYDYKTNLPMSHSIDLGGRMKGCVRIVVQVPDKDFDERYANNEIKKSIAHISWIGFNKKCAVNHDLPGGTGTRHMVRTAMTIVLSTYSWIESFSLTDASNVECRHYKVNLSHISLSLHGKTYYHRYFHAHLNSKNQPFYLKGIEMLNKPMINFETMCKFIDPQYKELKTFKRAYDPKLTNIEYFNKLHQQCKEDGVQYCEITEKLLENLMNICFDEDALTQKWFIDAKDVKRIPTLEWSECVDAKRIHEVDMMAQEEFVKGGRPASAIFGAGDY